MVKYFKTLQNLNHPFQLKKKQIIYQSYTFKYKKKVKYQAEPPPFNPTTLLKPNLEKNC